jgi:hypothetical protein
MFFRRPPHRVFDYTPRHYDPTKDESEKLRRRLGFSRYRRHKGKKRSPIIWLVFILAVIYLFLKFGGTF